MNRICFFSVINGFFSLSPIREKPIWAPRTPSGQGSLLLFLSSLLTIGILQVFFPSHLHYGVFVTCSELVCQFWPRVQYILLNLLNTSLFNTEKLITHHEVQGTFFSLVLFLVLFLSATLLIFLSLSMILHSILSQTHSSIDSG